MITSKKIKELDERYNIILNELVKTYPNYKVYPNIESISREFTVDSENLLEVQTEFFQLRDKIQSQIDKKVKNIKQVELQIKVLEKKNNKLINKLTDLENDNAAAKGMLDDIQFRYNEYLLGNWILFISLIGSVVIYFKSNNKKNYTIYNRNNIQNMY